MFTPPTIPTTPEAVELTFGLLKASNEQLLNLMRFRHEQFETFWFRAKHTLRTPAELNAILQTMDEAQPGQSIQFFLAAKALVDLIEVLSPGRLQPQFWMPPLAYTVANGALRIDELPPPPIEETEGPQ
jgi:hypothetical protein